MSDPEQKQVGTRPLIYFQWIRILAAACKAKGEEEAEQGRAGEQEEEDPHRQAQPAAHQGQLDHLNNNIM